MKRRTFLRGAAAAGALTMVNEWPKTASAADESVFKSRLNGMDLWIDRETGSIVYLASPATGVLLEGTRGQSGLLDLAYPTKEFAPLRLASRFSKAQVVQEGNRVTIKWESLGPSRDNFPLPEGRVRAQVEIRAADDGRSLILSCRIENYSKAPVPQILFPDFWGLTPSNGVEGTELRLARGVVRPFATPFRKPETDPAYFNLDWHEYPAKNPPTEEGAIGGYYVQNALRWLDFGGLAGGFSIFQKKWGTMDPTDILTCRTQRDPMHLRMVWQHKDTINPGEAWESGEFWLTAHPGGWAKGIEVFRDYVRQANPPRALPTHIQNGIGFRNIWMIQSTEKDPAKAAFRYRDIPRAAEDAIEHGLDEMVLWGWSDAFTLPIHYRKALGTEQELFQGIQQAKALGVNVAPFVSIHIILNSAVARYGVKPGHDDWTYHPELIPPFRPYYAHEWEGTFVHDDNLLWQQDARAALIAWVNRGMRSLAFDQFLFKETPGQKPGLIKIIEQVRSVARSKDPQSTFCGESAADLELENQVLDYTWNWVDYVDAGPIVSVLRSPRLNCNIEDSALATKRCFLEGLYLNVMPSKPDEPNGTALIRERPLLAKALKTVARLRKQFLPYFVEGNALGESVLSQAAPAFIRAYQLRDRLLVFVLNDRPDAQHVALNIDLGVWSPKSNAFRVKYFDEAGRLVRNSNVATTRWLAVTELLQPEEIAAFELLPD